MANKLTIRVVNRSKHPLPQYHSALAAGADLRANIDQSVTLAPLQRVLVGTGIYMELPAGYEAQIRPRSGLAAKHGITVINTPGTIDADYRGEIKVCLVNISNESYTLQDGDRIAQMVIARHETAEFMLVETLSETDRGEGGYGHTGK